MVFQETEKLPDSFASVQLLHQHRPFTLSFPSLSLRANQRRVGDTLVTRVRVTHFYLFEVGFWTHNEKKTVFKIYTLVSIGVSADACWRCFNWLMSKDAGPKLGTHPGRGMIPLWLTIGVTFCVGVDITSTGRSLETPGVIDWPSADIPESFWSFELWNVQ